MSALVTPPAMSALVTPPAMSALVTPQGLANGISHLADASSLAALLSRLERGAAVRIGVLGASVAQNGGCLPLHAAGAEDYWKRCNDYDGYGGRPTGYLVRFLAQMRERYPRTAAADEPDRLDNGALDATALQWTLPCLFSHLRMPLDLVIVEPGSMAPWLEVMQPLTLPPTSPLILALMTVPPSVVCHVVDGGRGARPPTAAAAQSASNALPLRPSFRPRESAPLPPERAAPLPSQPVDKMDRGRGRGARCLRALLRVVRVTRCSRGPPVRGRAIAPGIRPFRRACN
jgi:hypothetical protein